MLNMCFFHGEVLIKRHTWLAQSTLPQIGNHSTPTLRSSRRDRITGYLRTKTPRNKRHPLNNDWQRLLNQTPLQDVTKVEYM